MYVQYVQYTCRLKSTYVGVYSKAYSKVAAWKQALKLLRYSNVKISSQQIYRRR